MLSVRLHNVSVCEGERVKGENGGNRRWSYDTEGLPPQGLNGMTDLLVAPKEANPTDYLN